MITLKDRVKEYAVVAGVDSEVRFTGRTTTAYRAFLDVMSENDETIVCVESATQFEVIQGVLLADSNGGYVARGPSSGNTVLSSSNGDDWVDFEAGSIKFAFCDLHAGLLLLGQNFAHGEIPSGVINGDETGTSGNQVFVLNYAPDPADSLLLVKDDIGAGLVMYAGTHFNLSGNTITFTSGNIPRTGAGIRAWYQHRGI